MLTIDRAIAASRDSSPTQRARLRTPRGAVKRTIPATARTCGSRHQRRAGWLKLCLGSDLDGPAHSLGELRECRGERVPERVVGRAQAFVQIGRAPPEILPVLPGTVGVVLEQLFGPSQPGLVGHGELAQASLRLVDAELRLLDRRLKAERFAARLGNDLHFPARGLGQL